MEIKTQLAASRIKVDGALQSQHKYLVWIFYPKVNEILIQGFENYPMDDYLSTLRKCGCVIKIVPINSYK